jgi:hypothetical protein
MSHPFEAKHQGVSVMEILVPFAVLAVWFILQIWVLPRFGVRT